MEREEPWSSGIPFLLVDALVIRMRKVGRVRLYSVLITTGINREGYREILGLMIGDSESEANWSEFFSWLKVRGLHGVDLVVSDDHKGLVKAVEIHFQGATWQRCQTHFVRNILEACPKALQRQLHGGLRLIFDVPAYGGRYSRLRRSGSEGGGTAEPGDPAS